jgi:hypothetical protein
VAEAANIEYIVTIPPYLFLGFKIEHKTYIAMDYINASELMYAAKTLSPEQQRGICSQLKQYIAQMRALKPSNPRLFDIRLTSNPFPPFAFMEEFHARLGHEFVLKSPNHRHMWSHFEVVSQRRYHTTFTHIQISRRETSLSKTARLRPLLIGSRRVGILNTGSILDGQLATTRPHIYGTTYETLFWILILTS